MRALILFFLFFYGLYPVGCRGEKEETINGRGPEKISTELSEKQSEIQQTTEITPEENIKTPTQERKNLPPVVQSIRVVAINDETNKGFRAIVKARDP